MRLVSAIARFSTAVFIFLAAQSFLAQPTTKPTPTGKSVFFDSDGREISNNEFVDIRMANFHYPDATITKTLEDGTVEFRLQKIPQEGMAAPNFTVRTIDGKTIALTELKGKVVVLSFWFIGCPACLNMEPKLNSFKAKFGGDDKVVFLAMTADPAGSVRKYLAKERFDYLQATDARDALASFTFGGYPKNIVVSKTGEIIYWRSTVRAWDKFESVVRAALAKD